MMSRFRGGRRWLAAAGFLTATACTGGSPLAPSAIIRPDAAIIVVGHAQTFSVENAVVTGFTIASDAGGSWSQFVRVEPDAGTNAIQLTALKRTAGGYIYVSATIGAGRTPLVAVVSIE